MIHKMFRLLFCSAAFLISCRSIHVQQAIVKQRPAENPNKEKLFEIKRTIKSVGPVLAASFCAAAIMYPLDLVRALQMANMGSASKYTTIQLLDNFKKTHGMKGFFTQGLAPELARATWMRFLKFSLFPVAHFAIKYIFFRMLLKNLSIKSCLLRSGISESKGTPKSKAIAAIIAAVPEVFL